MTISDYTPLKTFRNDTFNHSSYKAAFANAKLMGFLSFNGLKVLSYF